MSKSRQNPKSPQKNPVKRESPSTGVIPPQVPQKPPQKPQNKKSDK